MMDEMRDERWSEAIRKMDASTRKGKFLARGDGLIQFPAGKYRVSVGFGGLHYGSRSSDLVEVAVFDENDKFVTRKFVPDAEEDGVGIVDMFEFQRMLMKVVLD